MRRTAGLILGLVGASLLSVAGPARGGETEGYKVLGDLAVMERGRIKPLHTLAIERVKSIYSRSEIKLRNAEGEVVEKWGPVAAITDWTVRPAFWDEQEFILVEYLPLKRLLLGPVVKDELTTIAGREDLAPAARNAVKEVASAQEVSSESLSSLLALGELSKEEKATIAKYAHKLAVDNKWLAPADLETTEVDVEGQPLTLIEWFGVILQKKEQARGAMGASASKLTAMDEKAGEVAERLFYYIGFRDGNPRQSPALDLNVMPRPSNDAYLQFTADAYMKELNSPGAELTALERSAATTLDTYLRDLQGKDRVLPGQVKPEMHEALGLDTEELQKKFAERQAEFNPRFAAWLKEKADWIPLRVMLGAELDELERAGYEKAKVEAFRDAHAAVSGAEADSPNALPVEKASALIASARGLGGELGKYPTPEKMSGESHFNRFAPFYKAPMAYGLALILLLLSLGISADRGSAVGRIGAWMYWGGMAAFVGGILLEVYGFYLRINISGWAPVTNMYETVIWVALVTSVIGFVLEMLSRKKYPALAASGVALLATVLAANVSLLDPTIGSLQPVLRSNYWLTIHVLTIVSSYAAFALALGLGLLAVGFYLTATYKRSASYVELIAPAAPGIPLLLIGITGLVGSYQGWRGGVLSSDPAYYATAVLAGVGGILTIVGLVSAFGELCNRSPRKAAILGSFLLLVSVPAVVLGMTAKGPAILASWQSLYLSWIVAIMGGCGLVLSLFGDLAGATMRQAREQLGFREEADYAAYADGNASRREGAATLASSGGGGVATLSRPSVSEIRESLAASRLPVEDARALSMQATAMRIKPLSNFIYRAMQVGVLLCAAGTILGGVWADYSWGRFWGWDPKEVWALITLLVYLVPLHGRFAGWVNTFGLVVASVVCFLSVLMAWYGVNFVLGVGLHSYGFVEGGGQGIVMACSVAVLAVVGAAGWRRKLSSTSLPASEAMAG